MQMMNTLYLSTDGDRVTHLSETLEVESYHCAIVEMHGTLNQSNKPYYLCSDIAQDVFVAGRMLPVLREVVTDENGTVVTNLSHKIWLNVTRRGISKIRLYIVDEEGNILSFPDQVLYCTLLLIPHRKWLM